MLRRLVAICTIALAGACGRAASDTTAPPSTPSPTGSGSQRIIQVAAGGAHACALDAAGIAFCWGDATGGASGIQKPAGCGEVGKPKCIVNPTVVQTSDRFTHIAIGDNLSCGLTTDGAVDCWGSSGIPRFYRPTDDRYWVPARLQSAPRFKTLEVGATSACGLTDAGAAYCWGENSWGQLGADTPACSLAGSPCSATPVAVSGALTFTQISVGATHACAITSAGEAYCWGRNSEGELGSGQAVTKSAKPLAVATALRFSSISAGREATCAVATIGGIFCWGTNQSGQLGDGTQTKRDHPTVPVNVAAGLKSVAVAQHTVSDSACGIDATNSAYCWGSAYPRQPGLVSASLRFSQVAVGGYEFDCGLSTDGRAYCWGDNSWNQLGRPTTSTEPLEIVHP